MNRSLLRYQVVYRFCSHNIPRNVCLTGRKAALLCRHFYHCVKHIRLLLFRLRHPAKKRFECPICEYGGPFEDINPQTGLRKHARCPQCGSLERHRLQYLVLHSVMFNMPTAQMKMLHVAPEAFLKDIFRQRFRHYETADIAMNGVDHKADLRCLPFADAVYDVVFASHVLEHIADDKMAIQEIRRVLKPNGIAVLPVPIVSEYTIEYAEPNQQEYFHVRAPGPDYFDRYMTSFSKVVTYSSDDYPERYQLFIYEERSGAGANTSNRHVDIVPVCYA